MRKRGEGKTEGLSYLTSVCGFIVIFAYSDFSPPNFRNNYLCVFLGGNQRRQVSHGCDFDAESLSHCKRHKARFFSSAFLFLFFEPQSRHPQSLLMNFCQTWPGQCTSLLFYSSSSFCISVLCSRCRMPCWLCLRPPPILGPHTPGGDREHTLQAYHRDFVRLRSSWWTKCYMHSCTWISSTEHY